MSPLPVITFDPELEALLTNAVRAGPQALYPFEPALSGRLTEAVRDAVQPLLMAARSAAIVTAPPIRAAVSRLLRAQMADLPVLSVLEIPETKTIDVIAVVGGQGPAAAALTDQSEEETR